MPAPKPLSMLTTDTPGDDAVRAASNGVIPCSHVDILGKKPILYTMRSDMTHKITGPDIKLIFIE